MGFSDHRSPFPSLGEKAGSLKMSCSIFALLNGVFQRYSVALVNVPAFPASNVANPSWCRAIEKETALDNYFTAVVITHDI